MHFFDHVEVLKKDASSMSLNLVSRLLTKLRKENDFKNTLSSEVLMIIEYLNCSFVVISAKQDRRFNEKFFK